jgi:uncharacterized protein YkwD
MSHRPNRLALWLLALVCPFAFDAVAHEALPQDITKWRMPSRKESQIVWGINAQRRRHGRAALSTDGTLNAVAHRYARQMAHARVMGHVLGSSTPTSRVQASGYGYRAIAETVASGYSTADQAVAGWLASPGHRHNMLDEGGMGYTEIGVGAYREPGGQWYYCTVFGRPAD